MNEHPNVLSNGDCSIRTTRTGLIGNACYSAIESFLSVLLALSPHSDKKGDPCGLQDQRASVSGASELFAELTAWPGLKVILVIRRNTLESLRSFVQARQTRQWLKFKSDSSAPPPPVCCHSPPAKAYFKAADDFHARVVNAFDSSRIRFNRVREAPSRSRPLRGQRS